MLISLVFLLLAALLGAYLVFGRKRAANRMIGLLHGVLGVVGLLELVVGLSTVRGLAAKGLGGFGNGAEILLGVAALLGLGVAMATWQGRRPWGVVVAVHASVAVGAIALVMALFALD